MGSPNRTARNTSVGIAILLPRPARIAGTALASRRRSARRPTDNPCLLDDHGLIARVRRRLRLCHHSCVRLLWILFILAMAFAALAVWATAVADAWRNRERQLPWLIALVATLPVPLLAVGVAIAHHVLHRRNPT